MKNLFKAYFIVSLILTFPLAGNCQCGNLYAHTYNYYATFPGTINVDITGSGGATNLRIRTFQDGNGNKVIMDNPDGLSTIKFGGVDEDFYSLNTCGLLIDNTPSWTSYGLLAENSNPKVHVGTSYIPLTLRINGVYKNGWVKIGITQTADSVFLYSLMIDQTSTSPSFTIGQCDVTWPSVCTTTDIPEVIKQKNTVDVFPNPTTQFIQINFGVESGEITLKNTLGQIAYQNKFTGGSHQIDMLEYPAGIYIVTVQAEKKYESVRVIKQ